MVITNDEEVLLSILRKIARGENKSSEIEIDNINWNIVLSLSVKQGIFPLVFKAVYHSLSINLLEEWETKYKSHIEKIDRMLHIIRQVLDKLGNDRFSFLIMKGLPLSFLLYGDIYSRQTSDIDILLFEKDIPIVYELLGEFGYRSVVGVENPYENSSKDVLDLPFPLLKAFDHHECFELFSRSDHHDISIELQRFLHEEIRDLKILETFIASRIPITVNGVCIPTFDVFHTFFCLCENAYNDMLEGTPKLRSYLDIFVYIKKYINPKSWDSVITKSNQYKLGHVFHLILHQINDLFGTIIKKSIVESFMLVKPKWNWGEPIDKLVFASDIEIKNRYKRQVINYCIDKELGNIQFIQNEETNVNAIDNYHYASVLTPKFKLRLRYLIKKENDNICFYIYFENVSNQFMYNYNFAIIFMDITYSENYWKSIELIWDDKIRYKTNKREVSVLHLQNTSVMKVEIPIDEVMETKSPRQIALFRFSIIENPFYNVKYYWDISPGGFAFTNSCIAISL
ncbi:nucleotidyltransferase family protein [Paenibacillus durus]|uniref:Uncharacterized protein n=1 Tax=Paenibacillus durus TaxID=44251 RepID=A0A089HWD1_PAEDU|nr:nucleotidyltransferase family protein [Paenibacillus durus]AIQ15080.1 hypothetical protein PDUR_26805 [Paenibacillus durus]